jgi:hypothetical protein
MNNQDLIELRELFRKKFKENDFCIGEEEVEKVFRELLSEPEPVESIHSGPSLSADEISQIIESALGKANIKSLFDGDSALFKYMTKK